MELTGLASGTDWSTIIEQLMYIERTPIRNWEGRQEEFSNDKFAWQDINSRLLSLKTKTEDLLTVTTWGQMSATSNDTSVFTASASISAEKTTHDIKVKELAQNHRVGGTQVADPAAAIGAGDGSGTYTFTINGTNVDVADNYSLNDVKDAINSTTFAEGDETIASLVDNTLVIKAENSGAASALTFSDSNDTPGSTNTNEVLEQIGILTDGKAIQDELYTARDATFEIDGIEITRDKNTGITDVLTGITLNLTGVSDATGAAAWPGDYLASTLTIDSDTDDIYDKISDWVDQYNSSVGFIRDSTKYDSTSDEAGELVGNGTATSIQTRLSGIGLDRYSDLSAQYESLGEIGISLGDYGTDEQNELVIDETKLRAALATNPSWVEDLFGKDTDADSVRDYGIAASLKEYLQPLVQFNGILDLQESSLQDAIDGMDDRIASYENILELRERNLKATYTNLEIALAGFQNTSSWLSGQLANLSG